MMTLSAEPHRSAGKRAESARKVFDPGRRLRVHMDERMTSSHGMDRKNENQRIQGPGHGRKSRLASLTKAARFELRAQGTLVVGVYAGYIDTDMAAAVTFPKSSPDAIAARVLTGLENDTEEILADERAKRPCGAAQGL